MSIGGAIATDRKRNHSWPCDIPTSCPGGTCTLSHLTLQKQEIGSCPMGLMARQGLLNDTHSIGFCYLVGWLQVGIEDGRTFQLLFKAVVLKVGCRHPQDSLSGFHLYTQEL